MIEELISLLQSVVSTGALFHYFASPNTAPPYVVYSEQGQGEIFSADDQQDEYSTTVTIDIFSKKEKDPLFQQIYTVLNDNDISFYLKSVQYEPDTGLIHYEYEADVI